MGRACLVTGQSHDYILFRKYVILCLKQDVGESFFLISLSHLLPLLS